MKNNRNKLALVALVAILTACGGGGDSSTPTPQPPVAPPVGGGSAAQGIPLVASVPVATFAAGSEELAAFNKLNTERAACGFGQLQQDAALDKAAQAHNDYMTINLSGRRWSHTEDPVRFPTGFTGVEPYDRAVFQGYSAESEVSEGFTGVLQKAGSGVMSVRRLLNGPYHARAMLDGWTDVGSSVRTGSDVGSQATTIIGLFKYGYRYTNGKQLQPSGTLLTYPCNGLVGSAPDLSVNEDPSPAPSRDLAAQPAGAPIMMKVRDGEVLTVSSIAVFGPGDAPVVLMPLMTSDNDFNQRLSRSEAFVMPDQPLAAHTTYRVVINGSIGLPPINGVAQAAKPIVNHTFTFTTGATIGF
jgi:uncharacterized protein YkwD